MRYEYLVCLVQQGKVTWVNGEWAGSLPPDGSRKESAALESCPAPWNFLSEKGSEGWELIAATAELTKGEVTGLFSDQLELTRTQMLYLKRALTQ